MSGMDPTICGNAVWGRDRVMMTCHRVVRTIEPHECPHAIVVLPPVGTPEQEALVGLLAHVAGKAAAREFIAALREEVGRG